VKQVGNTILAKGGNHILAKRDNSAWPKGSKLSGFSSVEQNFKSTSHNSIIFVTKLIIIELSEVMQNSARN